MYRTVSYDHIHNNTDTAVWYSARYSSRPSGRIVALPPLYPVLGLRKLFGKNTRLYIPVYLAVSL